MGLWIIQSNYYYYFFFILYGMCALERVLWSMRMEYYYEVWEDQRSNFIFLAVMNQPFTHEVRSTKYKYY